MQKNELFCDLLQTEKPISEVMDFLEVSKTMVYKVKSNLKVYGNILKSRKVKQNTV